MKSPNDIEASIDITSPGSLPFVDFEITDFDELVSATERLQVLDEWVVRTPAGPLVVGYEQTREILRNPAWITVLSGLSALQSEQRDDFDVETLVTKAQEMLPEIGDQMEMRPNLLSVEGEDHKRLRRLVSASFTPSSSETLRPFMREHADALLAPLVENGGGALCESHDELCFCFDHGWKRLAWVSPPRPRMVSSDPSGVDPLARPG